MKFFATHDIFNHWHNSRFKQTILLSHLVPENMVKVIIFLILFTTLFSVYLKNNKKFPTNLLNIPYTYFPTKCGRYSSNTKKSGTTHIYSPRTSMVMIQKSWLIANHGHKRVEERKKGWHVRLHTMWSTMCQRWLMPYTRLCNKNVFTT